MAEQFGDQVLIQPLVLGREQYARAEELMPSDAELMAHTETGDPYHVLRPRGWTEALDAKAARVLTEPTRLARMLDVNLRAVPLLGPAERQGWWRLAGHEPPDETKLVELLGPLGPSDRYFVGALYDAGVSEEPRELAPRFLENLRYVRTFITNARYDAVIYAPAIPAAIAKLGQRVVFDSSSRPGEARPGRFRVLLPDAEGESGREAEVRFPPYAKSGHMVAVTEGRELGEDIEAFLAARH